MSIEWLVSLIVFAITSLIIGLVYVSYMYMNDTIEAEQQVKAAERRAEVAERALNLAVSNYMCVLCPCADCDASIYGTQECIEMIIKAYKKQAEKELQEGKDE